MGILLVVSDQRGEGKTAVAVTLASLVVASGGTAALIKPFGAEDEIGPDSDSSIYRRLIGTDGDDWPVAIPDKGIGKKQLKDSAKAVKGLDADHDLVVVEASSQLTPEDTSSLAEALGAKVLVVARHRYGMTAADLSGWTDRFGDRLAGVIINARGRYLGTAVANELVPALKAAGIDVLAVLPDDRSLLGVTVGQLADLLDGELLPGDRSSDEGLVQHFLVGGWMLDEGALYFSTREDKAVIVRGDRPDLQMSALTTPTRCLVLTRGIKPIEYVAYEAEQEGTALLLVQQDTMATMEALGTVVESARFDHPAKVARMSEMMQAHADVDALAELTGIPVLQA